MLRDVSYYLPIGGISLLLIALNIRNINLPS